MKSVSISQADVSNFGLKELTDCFKEESPMDEATVLARFEADNIPRLFRSALKHDFENGIAVKIECIDTVSTQLWDLIPIDEEHREENEFHKRLIRSYKAGAKLCSRRQISSSNGVTVDDMVAAERNLVLGSPSIPCMADIVIDILTKKHSPAYYKLLGNTWTNGALVETLDNQSQEACPVQLQLELLGNVDSGKYCRGRIYPALDTGFIYRDRDFHESVEIAANVAGFTNYPGLDIRYHLFPLKEGCRFTYLEGDSLGLVFTVGIMKLLADTDQR